MWRDEKKHDGLRKHILASLASVFSRPRFQMKAEAREGWDLILTKGDDSYHLTVGVDHLDHAEVVVLKMNTTSYRSAFFYRNKFDIEKMPNLRKIGITIANKIKNAPVHDVMSA
jgi:hypothetical protein